MLVATVAPSSVSVTLVSCVKPVPDTLTVCPLAALDGFTVRLAAAAGAAMARAAAITTTTAPARIRPRLTRADELTGSGFPVANDRPSRQQQQTADEQAQGQRHHANGVVAGEWHPRAGRRHLVGGRGDGEGRCRRRRRWPGAC